MLSKNNILIRKRLFSSSSLCNGIIKKLHKPKTLEQSLKESDEENDHNDNRKIIKDNTKKDALSLINMGTKVPDNWRKIQKLPEWKRQKFALVEKFKGEKWNPNKKLSREQMNSVKILKDRMPEISTSELSQHFEVSTEAIRRILKSKWVPSDEDETKIMERWKRRGGKVKSILKHRRDNNEIIKQSKVLLNTKGNYTQVNFMKHGKSKSQESNRTKLEGAKKRLHKFDRTSIRKVDF
ncbi:hypothetical protein WICMUC_004179 [Wickerhamomyces mucosus]|uniref:Required for respiratory growth protein 9, mitochondrial n=1 Tax=Wickerhamomyces mucosus TaxID=1378264 RepID=A0A9P8PIC4_9ASCO|nr:hypothetical protein WICMUC_004179 [Wickerhamomyces mucosus]